MAVSEWLQQVWNHVPEAELPPEFWPPFDADQLLMAVNGGGFASWLERSAPVERTIVGLRSMGLEAFATTAEKAQAIGPDGDLDALDEAFFSTCGAIETESHRWIRDRIVVFESLETLLP